MAIFKKDFKNGKKGVIIDKGKNLQRRDLMSRTPRNSIKTSFFHIMVQGINKSYISNKESYIIYYIKIIKESEKINNAIVIAYCIMNNHAHLLLNTNNIQELSKFMQRLNTKYAMYYNKKYNRVGYVFRDRYKSEGIYSEKQFYACMNYIYNNPVKAELCKKREDYKFSNYKENEKHMLNNPPIEGNFIDVDNESNDDIVKKYINENNVDIENLIKNKDELKLIVKYMRSLNVSYRSMERILKISRETLRKYG